MILEMMVLSLLAQLNRQKWESLLQSMTGYGVLAKVVNHVPNFILRLVPQQSPLRTLLSLRYPRYPVILRPPKSGPSSKSDIIFNWGESEGRKSVCHTQISVSKAERGEGGGRRGKWDSRSESPSSRCTCKMSVEAYRQHVHPGNWMRGETDLFDEGQKVQKK